MAPTPSLLIQKTFTFRGSPRIYSNRYHFNGGVPASDSAWHTLMDNVTTAEQACIPATAQIVNAIGYAAGSDVPVSAKTYTKTGTLSASGAQECPGEVAALIRYATAIRTSKNHPVYLYNFVKPALVVVGGPYDVLWTTQKTAINTYASGWITGFSDGSVTYNRAGPNGASATGVLVETYVTHRDFPR